MGKKFGIIIFTLLIMFISSVILAFYLLKMKMANEIYSCIVKHEDLIKNKFNLDQNFNVDLIYLNSQMFRTDLGFTLDFFFLNKKYTKPLYQASFYLGTQETLIIMGSCSNMLQIKNGFVIRNIGR